MKGWNLMSVTLQASVLVQEGVSWGAVAECGQIVRAVKSLAASAPALFTGSATVCRWENSPGPRV